MKCWLKRVLPFALTLIFGLWLASCASSLKSPAEQNIELPRKRTVPVSIKHVPDILNPEAACRSQQGFLATIRLEALLGADGKVSEIKPALMLPYGVSEASLNPIERSQVSPFILNGKFVQRLPYGLTEAALEAARRIEFVPAIEDGKPISARITIISRLGYSPNPRASCSGYPNADTVIIENGFVRWRTRLASQAVYKARYEN